MNKKMATLLLIATIMVSTISGVFLGKYIILNQIAHDIKVQIENRDKYGITTPLNEEYTEKKIYMFNYVKDRTLWMN